MEAPVNDTVPPETGPPIVAVPAVVTVMVEGDKRDNEGAKAAVVGFVPPPVKVTVGAEV
jgi:hypothetical protein